MTNLEGWRGLVCYGVAIAACFQDGGAEGGLGRREEESRLSWLVSKVASIQRKLLMIT